jgi:hypothetical protein
VKNSENYIWHLRRSQMYASIISFGALCVPTTGQYK